TTSAIATSTFLGGLSVDTSTLVVNANENRVGILTTTPTSTLQIAGGNVHFQPSNGAEGFFFDAATNRVGIGTATPQARLDIASSTSVTSGSNIGLNNTLTANPTAQSSANIYAAFNTADYTSNFGTDPGTFVMGQYNLARNSGTATLENVVGSWSKAENISTGTINDSYGAVGQSRNTGAGTIVRGYGVVGASRNNSTGTVTNAVGVYGDIINASAGGVIENAYNIKAATPYSNAGTINNLYGVYIDLQSPPGGGTILDKWALYQAGPNDKSYFAGNVGMGTTTPAAALHVVSATAPQFRLGYDQNNYTNFSIGSDGAITLTPTNLATTTIANGLNVNNNSFVVQQATRHVGIGVSSATSTLTVLQTSATTPAITVQAAGSATANLLALTSASGSFLAGFTAEGGLLMNISSTTALNVQNNGTAAFAVNTGAGNQTYSTTTAYGYLTVASSTATTLFVDANRGRVGIGTTT
ncbi:MAG: hypothetical protein Q8O57_04980, partial [Kiritimatiellota bacterium]|nr:hypothetical protein [Kiritimatiellota bacterium]